MGVVNLARKSPKRIVQMPDFEVNISGLTLFDIPSHPKLSKQYNDEFIGHISQDQIIDELIGFDRYDQICDIVSNSVLDSYDVFHMSVYNQPSNICITSEFPRLMVYNQVLLDSIINSINSDNNTNIKPGNIVFTKGTLFHLNKTSELSKMNETSELSGTSEKPC